MKSAAKHIFRESDFEQMTPSFSNKEAALSKYAEELSAIADKYRVSVSELILRADAEIKYNKDFSRALQLSSQIYSLKN